MSGDRSNCGRSAAWPGPNASVLCASVLPIVVWTEPSSSWASTTCTAIAWRGCFAHKRVVDICQAFERLRKCYAHKRLFVVLDNLRNVHDHPTVLALMRKLHIHPVWTPTEASWLDLIEAQFGILKRFTVANTDDPTHAVRRRRIYRYLNYRHRNIGTQNHPLRRIRMVKVEQH